jgi:protease I
MMARNQARNLLTIFRAFNSFWSRCRIISDIYAADNGVIGNIYFFIVYKYQDVSGGRPTAASRRSAPDVAGIRRRIRHDVAFTTTAAHESRRITMGGAQMGKKILMLVGEFSEEYEIFVFEQCMHAVGHIVHVVCPGKKAGDVIKTSLHDFEGHQTYTEARAADYDAVYCAGGRGPEYIRIDKGVQKLVADFHTAGKPIFTICHGVQILIAVDGVVRGRQVAALQYCEPEIRLAGGIYVDVPPTGAHVDGNLVSAKGWPGLAAFMAECLRVLGTQISHAAPISGPAITPSLAPRGKKEKRRAEAA